LIADAHQPTLLVGPRTVHLALQARIDQFEIEHRDLGRIGMNRRRNHQRQCGGGEQRSHESDP
jgi:hypothetical protein